MTRLENLNFILANQKKEDKGRDEGCKNYIFVDVPYGWSLILA